MNNLFRKLAHVISNTAGSPWAFICSLFVVLIWGILGPVFKYSDTWQLVINTGTTIVTFLMVFLIQNTQNRDSKAIHMKLDELIRALNHARDEFVDLEDSSDEEIAKFQKEFEELKKKYKLNK
jgi:low affinity Fe/Cu permease